MTRTGIEAALNDLLFHREITLEKAAERHFTPGYRRRTDGEWADRAEFLDHIGHLRGMVAGGTVEVHDELYRPLPGGAGRRWTVAGGTRGRSDDLANRPNPGEPEQIRADEGGPLAPAPVPRRSGGWSARRPGGRRRRT
ncbi:hypothetical protein ACIOD1_34535 [Streptomyces sp. NPDC088097]|uniref:hypothetical protein n=1 Tax=Streptomyces sp. NPDC088097 TaxID=3365823 RepID=UPI0037FB06E8